MNAEFPTRAPADHHCFACGATNPIGMQLQIELQPGRASTTWEPSPDFVGWSDRVHGGLLATLLDEVMAWAPTADDAWAVTSELTIRFRSSAGPGEKLSAHGWVEGRRRRIYDLRGEVRGADGRVVAEARGTFLGASPSQKAELKARYGWRPSSVEPRAAAPAPHSDERDERDTLERAAR